MIKLTRINDKQIVINSDIIEFVEEVPHTIICTVHNNKYVVKEKADEIIEKVIEYKSRIAAGVCVKGR